MEQDFYKMRLMMRGQVLLFETTAIHAREAAAEALK